ncbi:MAG: hypothetical protein DYG89_52915 [Caldilinea sp. CFX5]|nr:hypothetical protein [Caldilinea sp. CFX5]
MKAEGYDSFLVRCWRNQSEQEQGCCWHGEIEHIQSGVRWDFATLSDLLAFLQQVVATQAKQQWQPEDRSA